MTAPLTHSYLLIVLFALFFLLGSALLVLSRTGCQRQLEMPIVLPQIKILL
jgi:energy-converting hydrogenase Eha subunit H